MLAGTAYAFGKAVTKIFSEPLPLRYNLDQCLFDATKFRPAYLPSEVTFVAPSNANLGPNLRYNDRLVIHSRQNPEIICPEVPVQTSVIHATNWIDTVKDRLVDAGLLSEDRKTPRAVYMTQSGSERSMTDHRATFAIPSQQIVHRIINRERLVLGEPTQAAQGSQDDSLTPERDTKISDASSLYATSATPENSSDPNYFKLSAPVMPANAHEINGKATLTCFNLKGEKITLGELLETAPEDLKEQWAFTHPAELFPLRGSIFKKTFRGTLQALCTRQLSAKLRPEPKHVKAASEMFSEILQEIEDQHHFKYITVERHLAENVEPKKRPLYTNGWKRMQENLSLMKKPMTFTPNMKSNEVNYENPRPRLIMVPEDHWYAILTAVNHDLLRILKHAQYQGHPLGAVHALTPEGLKKTFSAVEEGYTFIAWDGSQHDSHQHAELIETIDLAFYKKFLERSLLAKEVPVSMIPDLIANISTANFNIKLKYPRTRQVAVKGTLKGTVFSGHTLATTLGNTLRVLTYVYYAATIAGIPHKDIRVWVAGDDATVAVPDNRVDAYRNALKAVYFESDADIEHGLGQVLKKSSFVVSKRYTIFLSKFIYRNPLTGKISTYRLPERLMQTGHITTKLKGLQGNLTAQEHATAIYLSIVSSEVPTEYQKAAHYLTRDRIMDPSKALNRKLLDKIESADPELFKQYKAASGGNDVCFTREFKMIANPQSWQIRACFNEQVVQD
jgi:hypothetical protein